MIKAVLLFSLVGLVLTGFFFSRGRSGEPAKSDLIVAAPSEDADGVIHVGAVRLWTDYDANAVAADNVYKERQLRVTGRLLAIERPFGGDVLLTLAGGNPMFHTLATLDSTETQRAATLGRESIITVQCTGDGAMMRMPILKECTYIATVAPPSR